MLHYLHGALCLNYGQLELAIQFAEVNVPRRNADSAPLWRQHDLTGWPKLLGGTCTWAWEYVRKLRESRPILQTLFALQKDFDMGLASYSMALSLFELATDAAKATPPDLSTDGVTLETPPLFVGMERETIALAATRTIGDRSVVRRIAERAGVKPDAMRQRWPAWKRLLLGFRRDVFDRWSYPDELPLGDLA